MGGKQANNDEQGSIFEPMRLPHFWAGMMWGLFVGVLITVPALIWHGFLTAKEPATYADWITAAATCLSVIAGVIGILFVVRSLKVAQETLRMQTTFNEKQSELVHAQVRPYLLHSTSELKPPDKDRNWTIEFHMKNFGKSPALHIHSQTTWEWLELVPAPPNSSNPYTSENRYTNIQMGILPFVAPDEKMCIIIPLDDDFFDSENALTIKSKIHPRVMIRGHYSDTFGRKMEPFTYQVQVSGKPHSSDELVFNVSQLF